MCFFWCDTMASCNAASAGAGGCCQTEQSFRAHVLEKLEQFLTRFCLNGQRPSREDVRQLLSTDAGDGEQRTAAHSFSGDVRLASLRDKAEALSAERQLETDSRAQAAAVFLDLLQEATVTVENRILREKVQASDAALLSARTQTERLEREKAALRAELDALQRHTSQEILILRYRAAKQERMLCTTVKYGIKIPDRLISHLQEEQDKNVALQEKIDAQRTEMEAEKCKMAEEIQTLTDEASKEKKILTVQNKVIQGRNDSLIKQLRKEKAKTVALQEKSEAERTELEAHRCRMAEEVLVLTDQTEILTVENEEIKERNESLLKQLREEEEKNVALREHVEALEAQRQLEKAEDTAAPPDRAELHSSSWEDVSSQEKPGELPSQQDEEEQEEEERLSGPAAAAAAAARTKSHWKRLRHALGLRKPSRWKRSSRDRHTPSAAHTNTRSIQ